MKQFLSILLLLCIVLSFAACAPETQEPTVPTSSPTEPSTQESSAILEQKKPVMEDITELLSAQETISCMALDESNFYLLTQDYEGRHHLSVRSLKSDDFRIYPLSPLFDYAYSMNVLPDGTLAVVAIDGESCRILSLSLQGEFIKEFPVENWQMQYVPILDELRGEFWYTDGNDNYYGVSIADESRRSFSHEGWLCAARNGTLVFSQANSPALYNADKGENVDLSWLGSALALYDYGAFYQRQDRLADIAPYDPVLFLDYTQPDRLYQMDGAGNVLYCGSSGTVFTAENQDGGTVLRALRPDKSLCLGQWLWEAAEGFSMYRQVDNGSVLAFYAFNGQQDVLYLWHYAEMEAEALGVSLLTPEALPSLVEEVSARIRNYSDFHLYVCPGDLAPDSIDYSFSADFTYLQSYLTLLDVERILNLFPQEMLHNLFGVFEEGLDLYFSTQFVPLIPEAINNANALTYTSDLRWVIVLTAGCPWDLPHELMHVMQSRLQELGQGEDWLSYMGYWNGLNPDGFTYFDSYHYDDSMETDRWTWNLGEDIWFIDAYSKTFASEDQCRIFEYLFLRDVNYFEDTPHLQEKARYLCAMLRSAYGCNGAIWERDLDIPPLEIYDDAVRDYTGTIVSVG